VIGVQREDDVQCTYQHRIRLVFFARGTEHHLHEVRGVIQIVARIHERLTHRVLIGHGDDGRHFGNDAVEGDATHFRLRVIFTMVVERRQRTDHADHDSHRMGVAAETVEETGDLIMNHGVVLDILFEGLLLGLVRQFAIFQQVGHFEEVALLCQLLDRVTAIQQLALVAVNVGDLRLAAGGREKTRVIGKQPGLTTKATDVDNVVTMSTDHDRKINGFLARDLKCRFTFAHLLRSFIAGGVAASMQLADV
jgi:hypothetical protein